MISLFVNAAQAAPSVSVNTSSMDAIAQASPVVQLTLVILVVMSVFCWAIGYNKFQAFKKMVQSDELFMNKFWKVNSLDTLYEDIDQYKDSSIARVFKAAYLEMKKISESPLLAKTDGDKPVLSGIDNLERILNKANQNEIAKLESKLTVLATTGSTGPFIGLFGTVWGIYNALVKIGMSGQASIDKVAGPVGESLIMTAIGLAVAVPAVLGYNWLVRRNKAVMEDVNAFGSDLHSVLLASSNK